MNPSSKPISSIKSTPEFHIQRAELNDLDNIREFHVQNHLNETCHCPGERKHQIDDLEDDFPQLFQHQVFAQATIWIATTSTDLPLGITKDKTKHEVGSMLHSTNDKLKIFGTIGLLPDNKDNTIIWLNTFSVHNSMRGKGIGTALIDIALQEASSITIETLKKESDTNIIDSSQMKCQGYHTIRLVTLGNHSEGKPVMDSARRLYERKGFRVVEKEMVKYGDHTTIDIIYYEKEIGSSY